MIEGGHGLMPLREAAAYLGSVSYETMRYWVFNLRALPVYKLGAGRGHVYVKKADLDALVARGFQPAVRAVPEPVAGRRQRSVR